MSRIEFARLSDLPPRDAWSNEAFDFTPWLAENIDQLAEEIGIDLELTDTEVAVEGFSADIVARDPTSDRMVLIENQLEPTDHGHLGQIMTYLAGLKADIAIWISPRFNEAHLSAVRWLNEHSADGFSFFAIKLRVVRIGDSPFAPVFEVLEKPNDWDRQLKETTKAAQHPYYDIKQAFWEKFLAQHPEYGSLGIKPYRYSANYVSVRETPNIEIALWIGRKKSGIYVRSAWGEASDPVLDALLPFKDKLESATGALLGPAGRGDHFLPMTLSKGHDKDDWDEIIAWMHRQFEVYNAALKSVFGQPQAT